MSKRSYSGRDADNKIVPKKMMLTEVPESDVPTLHFDAVTSIRAELALMRRERLFCDVTLRLDDGASLVAHRIVLAAGSDYFRAVFTCALARCGDGDAASAHLSEVAIHGVSCTCVLALLDFLYDQHVDLHVDTVHELLIAADYFGVIDLLGLCCDFLSQSLSVDNCVATMRFARCYKDARCQALANTAYSYLMVNFPAVVEWSAEFLALPVEELHLLLASDELNVDSEQQVWDCIVRWMAADKEARSTHLPRLLERVRLALLPPGFFVQHVRRHHWLAANEDTRRFLTDSVHAAFGSVERDARARVSQQTLFALGGWSGPHPTDVVETYDCRRDVWTQCADIADPSGPRAYHGAAVVGMRILVVGGFDGRYEYYNSCRWFDARRRAWSEAGTMHSRRCYVSVAVIGESVYAMGGYDGQFRHKTAERFCARSNQWEMIAPMKEHRSDASAGVLDGKVYVVGGFDGLECIASAEVYDPATGQWTLLRPMTCRRSGVSCIAHRGAIYALGGFDGENRLASCERLDSVTGNWEAVAEMLFARSNFGCELLGGKIHVFGGFNGNSTCPDTECLDEDEGCWLPRAYMHCHRSALTTVALYALPNRAEYFQDGADPTRTRVLELMSDWSDTPDIPPPGAKLRPIHVGGSSGDQ